MATDIHQTEQADPGKRKLRRFWNWREIKRTSSITTYWRTPLIWVKDRWEARNGAVP